MEGAAHRNIQIDLDEDISMRCTLYYFIKLNYKCHAALPLGNLLSPFFQMTNSCFKYLVSNIVK
jgi:hypothetical protein